MRHAPFCGHVGWPVWKYLRFPCGFRDFQLAPSATVHGIPEQKIAYGMAILYIDWSRGQDCHLPFCVELISKFGQPPENAGNQAKCLVKMQKTLVTNYQATTIVHPAKAALDFPTLLISGPNASRPTTLGFLTRAPPKSWGRGFDTATPKLASRISTVVGVISNRFFRSDLGTSAFLWHANGVQCCLGQRTFIRLGTVHMQTNRRAVTIRHNHHLATLADFGPAYTITLFLAVTKLPSRTACAHSSFVCASSSLRNARQMHSQVPSRDHSFNRR